MAAPLNPNFVEMLCELSAAGAEFMIVGAHALGAHGIVRGTLDFDIWINPAPANAARALAAITKFGAPLYGLTVDDLSTPGTIYQIGVKPARIDILTGLSGVEFDEAWSRHSTTIIDGKSYAVIGKDDLIRNKRASARPQDLVDADNLERQ